MDKPAGWTSHDVVDRIRDRTGLKKVGHAGTLDPPATGLLVLGLGRSTRLLRFIQALPKTYIARVVFGVATDTLDSSGAVLAREPMPITRQELCAVLDRFRGRIMQVPPMVSALRVDGERMYAMARRGQVVERGPRPVEVHDIAVRDFSPGAYPESELVVTCGKGTYVRSLADDIAQALGGRAHLGSLRRTAVGTLEVSEAISPELDHPEGHILSPAEGLRDLPAFSLSEGEAAAVRHGASIASPDVSRPEEAIRLLDGEGALLAVYRRSGGRLVPEVVLA